MQIGSIGLVWLKESPRWLKIGVSPKLEARQAAVGIAMLRPQPTAKKFGNWVLGAADWIGFALVGEIV